LTEALIPDELGFLRFVLSDFNFGGLSGIRRMISCCAFSNRGDRVSQKPVSLFRAFQEKAQH